MVQFCYITDYIEELKLSPVICCYEWQGWTWMETCKSWANVFKF